jgi:hypothetical protein
MSTTPQLVNAWIFLNEDEPVVNGQPVGYDDPQSCYQRLITDNVYRAVDILFICFATTVPTSSSTVPTGNGDFYTLQMGAATDPTHPGGLTNQDYMDYVIRDARANNPEIKIAMTLVWGEDDTISNIFKNSNYTPEENAQNFASNLLAYLKQYELDGFDIDWESPISDYTTQEQFRLLFTAIGTLLRSQDKKYYLSLSPAEVGNLDPDTVNANFDFVALQLYSGFTDPQDFINAGVNADLLAYGAKFEADGPSQPDGPGHQTAQEAHDQAVRLGYQTYTQWRLNSQNYEFEQDQQVELYKLVFSP